ncbi:MAG: azurin [Pseudomonadota bacterium]
MLINRTKFLSLTLLLAGAALAGCGGGDDKAAAPKADTMAEKAAAVADDAAATVADTAEAAKDTAGAMADDAAEAAGDMADAAKEAAGDMMGEASDAAAEMKDKAAGAAHDMGEMAEDAMADAKEAVAGAAAPADDNDPCTLNVLAGDNIAYSTNALSVPSSCSNVTVTLTHTGKLPKIAMGHNWVLMPESAVEEVAMAGMGAGADANYIPADEARIVAATDLVGGGESSSATFALGDLKDGETYVYVCTFPGHWSIMKGTFTIS